MESKAKTYEDAAMECAAKLSDEDIEFFRMHIGYTYHHFGYGLYLRNQYSYLLDDKLLRKFGDNYRDNLGEKIYHLMIPIMFPEYKGHEKYIDRITDMLFDDLNANYYLKFGMNFIADIAPEKFFRLPEYSKIKDDDFHIWFDKYQSENSDYALEIAERIWEYNTFRQTAIDLGYSDSEIKETHRLCVEFLKEKNCSYQLKFFLQKTKLLNRTKQ